MKTVSEHVEHIKGKPHHIRKRIAFTAAASGAIVIALVWFVGNISLGAFALGDTSFADAVGQGNIETMSNENGSRPADSGIAGVAAALQSANAPAHIEIVDTASSTRSIKKAEQTTIPF